MSSRKNASANSRITLPPSSTPATVTEDMCLLGAGYEQPSRSNSSAMLPSTYREARMRTKDKLFGTISPVLNKHLNQNRSRQSHQKTTGRLTGETICEIELGLYLLSQVLPQAPARAFWVLMTGYDFPIDDLLSLCPEQRRLVGTGRHILLHYKNARQWRTALERYREVDERFRLFDVDEQLDQFTRRAPSVCADREEFYAEVIRRPLPYAKRKIHWAKADQTYLCFDRRKRRAVTIPADFPLPPPPQGYVLYERACHPPLSILWSELLDTAKWMDEECERRGLPPRNWYTTLKRVRLRTSPDDTSPFLPAGRLHLEGSHHFVGMVSSGKSTLMDILAVWAARTNRHITLVVGDVIAVFDRVQLFTDLGLKAAPIIGESNRRKHRNRLHRVLTAQRALHPLLQQHVGFDYTSPACLLDGLRDDSKPFQMEPQPCLQLALPDGQGEETPEEDTPSQPSDQKIFACPFYSVCPYHLGQRKLVDASIWVATPASLVYTHVAPQLNRDRLRFIELVYRRSDLVIVDEADRVQVQLDQLFSPSITLMSKGRESWLGDLSAEVTAELTTEALGQFQYEGVRNWVKACKLAEGAVYSLYALLLKEPSLQTWIGQERDYFSNLTLLEKLTVELSGVPLVKGKSPHDHLLFEEFWKPFATFLSDPLGEKNGNDHELADLARQVIAVQDERVQQRLIEWLRKQPTIPLTSQEEQDYALRLEFALMVVVLSDRLDVIIRDWKQVEVILGLAGGSSTLFYSPPEDYAPLLPDAPMGNILGFQYLPSPKAPRESGDLRFFRCMGVGRWLLLHLHDLFAADGIAGPHALLLSSTSWAGTSPGYHVQLPVSGVLLAPDEEIEAINNSNFQLAVQRNRERQPIWISGKQGHACIHALEEMLHELSREDKVGYVIHCMNRWAIERLSDRSWLIDQCKGELPTLERVGRAFRSAAFATWRKLLRQPLKYSTLKPYARKALIWNQLVSVWQVIGRLVRGGCAAEVYFCDAKFAPRTANLSTKNDEESTSLLVGMKEVLA